MQWTGINMLGSNWHIINYQTYIDLKTAFVAIGCTMHEGDSYDEMVRRQYAPNEIPVFICSMVLPSDKHNIRKYYYICDIDLHKYARLMYLYQIIHKRPWNLTTLQLVKLHLNANT